MPACLTPESYDAWLGDALAPHELLGLLDQTSFEVAHELGYHAVSKTVNSVKNDGPELVEPIDL
jgi:putative SOS response-associated peptidase YedK